MEELIIAFHKNDVTLKKESIEKLKKYLSLLVKWNNVHSLTSVHQRDVPYVFTVEPLLFAKELSKFVSPRRCLDVGTGFGNPGVAMSLFFERSKFFLVDSSTKKTVLLRSALDMACFENIEVITSRVEEMGNEFNETFDLVVSRGVGTIEKIISYASRFVKTNGFVATIKAKVDKKEIPKAIEDLNLKSMIPINVAYPAKNVRRYALIYEKVERT